jgi:hypothetical protein
MAALVESLGWIGGELCVSQVTVTVEDSPVRVRRLGWEYFWSSTLLSACVGLECSFV